MPTRTCAYRWCGPKVHNRLDLAGATLHPNIIKGNQGRVAMLRTAAEWGYPHRTITPALTGWGRIHVIQVDGDRDTGTVTLLGIHGPMLVRLPDGARHSILPPTRTETLLRAVLAEYPPTAVTAALAEALDGVLQLRAHGLHAGEFPIWQAIEAVIAAPLRVHLDAWDDTHTAPADTTPTSEG